MEETPQRNVDGTFKPGQSGNPNGKPKGTYSLTGMMRRALFDAPDDEKKTRGWKLVQQILKQAEAGDEKAQKLVMNYIEGMPKQDIDLGVDKEGLPELTAFFKAMAEAKKAKQDGTDS